MSLKVSHIKKYFGAKLAVDDISFTMNGPGVFGLLGRNGAGKTTTIRMILGILEKNDGSILWREKDITRETVQFGYLPEERGLYPKVKVEAQLLYFAKLHGKSTAEAKQNLRYWSQRLGVEEHLATVPERLSKGNQQKVQLLSTLLHDPELIILDEPFSGLDPVNAELLKGIIDDLIQGGKYIIMSTHQMNTIEEHCEQLIILKDGRSVLQGNLREIKQGYGRNHLTVNCPENITSILAEFNLHLLARTALGFEIDIHSENQAYELLEKMIQNNIRLEKFEIREPTLHEIFIEKAGENA